MRIRSVKLRDYRSYGDFEACFADGPNIIWGENGAGKTNLLEAVFMTCGMKSWRASSQQEIIRHGAQAARIKAECSSGEREISIEMLQNGGSFSCAVNGVRKKSRLELASYMRCVLFSPEELMLVKGSPAVRRRFMDLALCQLRPAYGMLLKEYNQVLLRKSRALKDERFHGMVPEYNEALIKCGAGLISYRAAFIKAVSSPAAATHRDASGGRENLEMCYQTVKEVKDPFASREEIMSGLSAQLERLERAEKESGSCLAGVHKDDIYLVINGNPARAFASQGQCRTAALSLKFAERELFFRDMGEYPLFLLDDVLSELDGPRREFVSAGIGNGQTIITSCDEPIGNAAVIKIG